MRRGPIGAGFVVLALSAMTFGTGWSAIGSASAPVPSTANLIATRHGAAAPRPLKFLHSAQSAHGLAQIKDASGRTVLLRGVNIDGLVDYYKPSLRSPYPIKPAAYRHGRCPRDDRHVEGVPICSFDFRQMRRLGYDNVRLNVSWSLLEPTPGHIDRHYIARIAQVVRWAKRQRIWVTIDFHQDAWSKYVYTKAGSNCPPGTDRTRGYDGAPRWASSSRLPACTVGGTRELDLAVQHNAQRFWSDADAPDGVGLQEHYAHVVAVLASRFAHDPAVAGYDLMNEPEPGFLPEAENTAELLGFYAKVARTIRSAVPRFRQLLFLEPGVERNTTAARAFATSWRSVSSYRNAVYAPHIYTRVFTAGAVLGTPDVASFQSDYNAAVADAKALGLPLWIGEFGGPPATDKVILAKHYAQQEARRIGGTMWLWKENANDSIANTFWGVYGPPFNGADRRGRPQPERIRRTSRVYPIVTAGALLHTASDPFRGTARIVATSHHVAGGDCRHATLVDVPSVFTGRITVSGARVQQIKRSGAREVWLFPTGGKYSLRVRPVLS